MKTNNEKVRHLEKKGLDYNSYQSVRPAASVSPEIG